MSRQPRSQRRQGPFVFSIGRLIAILFILLIAGLAVPSAIDRMARPVPMGLSCIGVTPRACLASLSAIAQDGGADLVIPVSDELARHHPGDPYIQAFNASILFQAGREEEAAAFFANAARLGWREPSSQIFMFQYFAQQGQPDDAIRHLDSAFRVDPGLTQQEELVALAVSTPELQQAMATSLAANPDYIFDFLQGSADAADESWVDRIDTIDLAREQGLEVPQSLIRDLIRVVFADSPPKAAQLWAATQGQGAWADGSPVWTTDFETWPIKQDNGPFIWSATQRGMADLELAEAGGGRVIEVRKGGNMTAGSLMQTALLLGPGGHRISWSSNGDAQDIYPRAACFGGGISDIRDVQPDGSGGFTGIMVLGADCAIPMLNIMKGSGRNDTRLRLTSLRVNGQQILN